MSKADVFEFIKEQTLGKKDGDGHQFKITSEQILEALDFNEATVFANLKKLDKDPDVKQETYKVKRLKRYTVTKRYWWVEK